MRPSFSRCQRRKSVRRAEDRSAAGQSVGAAVSNLRPLVCKIHSQPSTLVRHRPDHPHHRSRGPLRTVPYRSERDGILGDVTDNLGRSGQSGDARKMFSGFYAVVLDHAKGSGRRVRWSPSHDAWLRSEGYGRYMQHPWLNEPGETYGSADAPTEEDQAAAIALANKVIHPDGRPFFCERCHKSDAASHFITPNIHSEPELYCLQAPTCSVVGSSGGGGLLKHWGSPFGCQSVKHWIDTGDLGRTPFIGPLAAYVFGRPLPADEVINREWCSRCAVAAENVRHNAAEQGANEVQWTRKQIRMHVLFLSHRLTEYYGTE